MKSNLYHLLKTWELKKLLMPISSLLLFALGLIPVLEASGTHVSPPNARKKSGDVALGKKLFKEGLKSCYECHKKGNGGKKFKRSDLRKMKLIPFMKASENCADSRVGMENISKEDLNALRAYIKKTYQLKNL